MGMDIFSRVAIESSAPFNYSFAILGGLDAKASPCNVGDKGSIPGSGRSAGEGNSKEQKEISLEYSVEGLMLKLKLQYFGHLMRRTDSLGKTLMLGKIEGRRRTG